jgi:glutamate racemase
MKIGIFDSGAGGLLIAKSLESFLPQYDYCYLGDTKRLPYGNRSQAAILEFTWEALRYLFDQGCGLVVVACNTASAEALRTIQQQYMPEYYPNRKVLGVLIPAAEAAIVGGFNNIGVLATTSTVDSGAYVRELRKLNPSVTISQQAAPLLVPLLEYGGGKWLLPVLEDYLLPLQEAGVQAIILGCTHYAALAEKAQTLTNIKVISQTDVVPASLADYLQRHPEVEAKLSKHGMREYAVTDLGPSFELLVENLLGYQVPLKSVSL